MPRFEQRHDPAVERARRAAASSRRRRARETSHSRIGLFAGRLVLGMMASLCHRNQSNQRSVAPVARPSDGLVYVSGAWRAPPRPPSASSITACSTATASSRASAPTTAASSSSNATSIACSTRPRRSASRSRTSHAEVCELVVETCRRNGISDGYIRLVVTRGPGDLGIDPRKCPRAELIVIARQLTMYAAASAGITVVTSTFRRNAPDATSPSIKSLNYLNNILARIEANDRGADEALMLDGQGYVAEATVDNFFIVTDHALLTPPTATNLKGDHARDAARRSRRASGSRPRRSRSRCSTCGRRRRRSSAAPAPRSCRCCRSTTGTIGDRQHRPGHRAASSPPTTSWCGRRARRFSRRRRRARSSRAIASERPDGTEGRPRPAAQRRSA